MGYIKLLVHCENSLHFYGILIKFSVRVGSIVMLHLWPRGGALFYLAITRIHFSGNNENVCIPVTHTVRSMCCYCAAWGLALSGEVSLG